MGTCCIEHKVKNQKLILDISPITNDQFNIISMQLKNNVICKIFSHDGKLGTGFFCNIQYHEQSKYLPVLITNNHVLNKNDLNNNQIIKIAYGDDKIVKLLTINESRITYTNEGLDISIIEIIPDLDDIYTNNFLEIDETILLENSNQIYIQKPIYILQYPKGDKLSFSLGKVTMIWNQHIEHLCSTESGSSGSPILNLSNFKVIGVHRGSSLEVSNIGIFFKYIIEDFKKLYPSLLVKEEKKYLNIIELIIENDIENFNDDKSNIHIFNTFSKLNSSNIDIYVNDAKCKMEFGNTLNLEKGKYKIKALINDVIKDCNCLFKDCSNLISIDLSSFDTKKVTNMSDMFSGCENLKSINLSHFNTENVTNMSYMFEKCKNLKEINLSSFNTENVTNMSYMFWECDKLEKIIFSDSFKTKKVKIMNNMFSSCKKLKSLDLSSFDFQNVLNMGDMFNSCEELETIGISIFNAKKVKNLSRTFSHCKALRNINFSIF